MLTVVNETERLLDDLFGNIYNMQIYRTCPYDNNYLTYLNKLWEDNWIYCWPLWDKLVFRKEVKERKARTVLADDTFEWFWKLYPNKKAKKDALIMWNRLESKEKTMAVDWLQKYLIYWKKKAIEKQFLPHPATWINGRRWEDNLSDDVAIQKTNVQEQISKEIQEEERLEKVRKFMNWKLQELKDKWLWDEWYNQAKSELPEWQQQYEALIIARIKMRINKT